MLSSEAPTGQSLAAADSPARLLNSSRASFVGARCLSRIDNADGLVGVSRSFVGLGCLCCPRSSLRPTSSSSMSGSVRARSSWCTRSSRLAAADASSLRAVRPPAPRTPAPSFAANATSPPPRRGLLRSPRSFAAGGVSTPISLFPIPSPPPAQSTGWSGGADTSRVPTARWTRKPPSNAKLTTGAGVVEHARTTFPGEDIMCVTAAGGWPGAPGEHRGGFCVQWRPKRRELRAGGSGLPPPAIASTGASLSFVTRCVSEFPVESESTESLPPPEVRESLFLIGWTSVGAGNLPPRRLLLSYVDNVNAFLHTQRTHGIISKWDIECMHV